MSILHIPCSTQSQRLPYKNLLRVRGKPLVRWVAEAAIEASCFERILVSSEMDLSAIMQGLDVECVPQTRSTVLQTTHDVVQGAYDQQITIMLATAILMDADDINEAMGISLGEGRPVITVSRLSARGAESFWWDLGKNRLVPTQYPSVTDWTEYGDAGALYTFPPGRFESVTDIYKIPDLTPYFLPRWKAVDIDTREDLELARRLFSANERHNNRYD